MFGFGKNRNIALLVDGPNIIRKEFSIDLEDLRNACKKHGRISTGRVYLNQYASEKLIEAVANQGLEPKVVLAGEIESDVDVSVAVDIVKAAYDPSIGIIALASRDSDFLPALQVAKEKGKTVIIIGLKSGFSKALQHIADHVEIIERRR
jgi:uncharacterized protein (TIGR00288 family)